MSSGERSAAYIPFDFTSVLITCEWTVYSVQMIPLELTTMWVIMRDFVQSLSLEMTSSTKCVYCTNQIIITNFKLEQYYL